MPTIHPPTKYCPGCDQDRPRWAFSSWRKSADAPLCKDCVRHRDQKSELDAIPEHELRPHKQALFINGERDVYPAVTIVGERDSLMLVMFDSPLRSTNQTKQYITTVKPDYIYTGPGVADYIAMQEARLQRLRGMKGVQAEDTGEDLEMEAAR